MIVAKANDTYIVYRTDNGGLIKEYPSGTTVKFGDEESEKDSELK